MKDLSSDDVDSFVSGKDASIVLFHASWCPFCRKFRPVFESYEGKTKARLAEALVDEDENPMWERFSIQVVPTVIAFRNGKTIARRDGKAGAGLFDKDMESLLAEAGG